MKPLDKVLHLGLFISFFMAFTFKPTIKALLIFISLLAPGASSALYAINDEVIPFLRSIVLNGDSVIELPSAKDLIISYKMHDIILEMEAADTMAYQFLLEGYDKKWSPDRKSVV